MQQYKETFLRTVTLTKDKNLPCFGTSVKASRAARAASAEPDPKRHQASAAVGGAEHAVLSFYLAVSTR